MSGKSLEALRRLVEGMSLGTKKNQNPKKRPKQQWNLTPYQGKKRCFGYFFCLNCKQSWMSGNSWANRGQQCKECEENIYPFRQMPLEKHGGGPDNKKPHPTDLCEKCEEIGYNCRMLHVKKGRSRKK